MKFPDYAKVKDNACITYVGPNIEYLIQLSSLYPYIEKSMYGLNIDIFGRDAFCDILPFNIKPISSFVKTNYAYVKILSGSSDHPVVNFLNDCQISYGQPHYLYNDARDSRLCIVAPNALLPSKSLNTSQMNKAIEYAERNGYMTKISNELKDIRGAGWVIGPENGLLFLGGVYGLKTSLIPNGLGEKLYKTMFPQGEILTGGIYTDED